MWRYWPLTQYNMHVTLKSFPIIVQCQLVDLFFILYIFTLFRKKWNFITPQRNRLAFIATIRARIKYNIGIGASSCVNSIFYFFIYLHIHSFSKIKSIHVTKLFLLISLLSLFHVLLREYKPRNWVIQPRKPILVSVDYVLQRLAGYFILRQPFIFDIRVIFPEIFSLNYNNEMHSNTLLLHKKIPLF